MNNKKAIELAVKKIKKSYSKDVILIQAINLLDEEEKIIKTKYDRLKEFFWKFWPEAEGDLVEKAFEKPKSEMGYDLNEKERKFVEKFARNIKEERKFIEYIKNFVEENVKKLLPKTSKIISPLLLGKLIALAGGIKKLAFMPASTIQLLGAEKALFSHLKKRTKCPKYGIIYLHELVQNAKNKGKVARELANKIAISIRQDYFGEKNVNDN